MLCPKCSASLEDGAKFCDSCGSEVDSTPKDPFLGRILLNQYVIQKKLGEGGYGSVYEAEQPAFRRKVAIKTLHKHLTSDPKVVKRFHREGMVASQLEQNPSAVKMLNVGETEDGYLWIAMEFIQGETLDDRIQRGPLSIPELLEIMGPVCNLLDEAHQKTIIHRDLKPDNIMLTQHQGRVIPKVLDFGIAGIVDHDEANRPTKTGMVTGTPPYMPPEQWRGLKHTDARSDVYALGVIVYECLSGKLPFEAETVPDWMIRHVMQAPKELSAVMERNPPPKSVEKAVMKALEKEPKDRYQSAGEFFRALSAIGDKLIEPIKTIEDAPRAPKPTVEVPPQKVSPATTPTLPQMGAAALSAAATESKPSGAPEPSIANPPQSKGSSKAILGAVGLLAVAGLAAYALYGGGASTGKGVAPPIDVKLPDSPLTKKPEVPSKSWVALTSNTTATLTAISGSGSDNIYAVGDSGTILHSTDGKSWRSDQLEIGVSLMAPGQPSLVLSDVWVAPNREALIVHESTLFRGYGEEWTALTVGRRDTFRTLWSGPGAPLYVAGTDVYRSPDGLQWFTFGGFVRRDMINSIWGRGGSFVIAVGEGGLLAVSRDQATTWERIKLDTTANLNEIKGDDKSLYAVGDEGVFLSGDAKGDNWKRQSTNTTDSLRSLWLTPEGSLYAVGAHGTILFSSDQGSTWSKQESNTTYDLNDIWGSSEGALYVVGEGGTILMAR